MKSLTKAALRRDLFQDQIDGPNQEIFLKIFAMVAKKRTSSSTQASLIHLLKNQKYPTSTTPLPTYQKPDFLIDQIDRDLANFEGIPQPDAPPIVVGRAWAQYV